MVGGAPQSKIARLNLTGDLDDSFAVQVSGGSVFALAVQWDGKVLLGGDFATVNGRSCANLARVDANGVLDTNFCQAAAANGPVYAIGIDAWERVLVGGNFTSFLGGARNRIARLLASGALDVSFTPGQGANNTVFSLASLPDGRVLIAGGFTEVDGHPRNHVALLNGGPAITQFQPLAPPAHGVLTLVVNAQTGLTCVLEVCNDLRSWVPVATNTVVGGTATFHVTTGTAPGGSFYRALVR